MNSREHAIWEIEYLKCHKEVDFNNYITKYKNTENPFVKEAKIQAEKLANERVEHQERIDNKRATKRSLKNIQSDKKINVSQNGIRFGKVIGIIAVICAAFFIRQELRTSFEDKQKKEYLSRLETQKQLWDEKTAQWAQMIAENNRKTKELKSKFQKTSSTSITPKKETSNLENTGNRTGNVNYGYYNNPVEVTQTQINEIDNSRWVTYYNETYNHMANTAEKAYNSLTNLGTTWRENNQEYGTTGRNDVWIASQISQFKKMQQDLQNIRHEASRMGISISPAPVESYNINI